ncbi:Sec-independent protein translocase protein TatB [Noviherbaspirillum autotrophicum]|jgi:sec-independent protein translocase protein TatB|uniref:Sec-independent protein translocase protein TatB n=1 Tax=Noviherbaspirillum autotrophicum TaxID=709839 RepID=A0A0C1YIN1_9BURK|nr:Sec-independent protein translocase protein TatB [Noviherbaspirillum autotrophicum]KIF80352.1 preprotein translocase [Noviherbaspirillum autotrophicum]
MIDLGLSKLALIGVVALVVVGPERLPKVARMAGTLFGRAQRYINDVKSEVSREIELEELRKVQKEMQEAASNVEQTIAQNMSEVEKEVGGAFTNPLLDTPTPDLQVVKAKDFRKKKLARTSAVPSWFKKQTGRKTHVLSGAARVAKYRPASAARKTTVSFH